MDCQDQDTLRPSKLDFSPDEQKAVYKAFSARRDIRSYLPDPVPKEILERILHAAHLAPSVDFMQPWNFIVISDRNIQNKLYQVVEKERLRASANYDDLKQDHYLRLKLEGLLQAPMTICVTNHSGRGGPHVLGRNTIPETDLMSTACAIENMWLAARVEGIAMGWISIYQKQDIRNILGIPDSVDPVALLTIGYTSHFPDIPVLERVGWAKRLDLKELVFQNQWDQKELDE
nr:5,6-dimethylbenzimidazole synthase [Neobacillus fumarioli]